MDLDCRTLERKRMPQKQRSFDERLFSVKNFVSATYERSGLNTAQVRAFCDHNETILEYSRDLASKSNLSKDDREALELAAALHDVSKGDSHLLAHGFEGAKIAQRQLISMGFNKETVTKVSNAIERHMGPIPGFMAQQAKRYKEQTGKEIVFPRPQTQVDKLLYDADMLSLIDKQGIDKILTIRENVEVFKQEDIKTAAEKNITQKEAAWLSALKSAKEAANSLFTDAAKSSAKKLLDQANNRYEELFPQK